MKRRTIIITIVAAVLCSPYIFMAAWIAGGTLYGKIDQWRYSRTEEFRRSDWIRPDRKYRYSVLDHVAARIVSVGMTEEEVERLLGKPDFITQKREWQYETRHPGWRFIDFSGGGLLLEFDSRDRVSRITKNLWVD